jgi:hypothetical protein
MNQHMHAPRPLRRSRLRHPEQADLKVRTQPSMLSAEPGHGIGCYARDVRQKPIRIVGIPNRRSACPHHDRTDELAIFDTVGDIQASAKVFSFVTPSIRHSLNNPRRFAGSAVVAGHGRCANVSVATAADVDKQQRGDAGRPVQHRMSAFGSVEPAVTPSWTCQL